MLLNEELLNLIFKSFYHKFQNNVNTKIYLLDIGNYKQLQFYIEIFTSENIKFNFTEKGELNIKMTNLKLHLTGYNIFYEAKFNDSIGVLSLEQNIILKSKLNDSRIYLPVFDFKEEPIINFEFNSNYNNEFIINNLNKLFLNKTFNNDFVSLVNNTLNFINNNIPKDFEFFYGGIRLDLNMIGPIEPRNNSIQINTYGFLYSEHIERTQNRTKFSLSTIPSIQNNTNQIYISTYSISSCLYTNLLNTNRYQIIVNPNILKLQYMFPKIRDKFKTTIFYLFFTGTPDIKIELLEGFMNIEFPATFEIMSYDKNPIFISQVELILKTQFNTLDYDKSKIGIFVDDIDLKTLKIERNNINNDTYYESQFQYGFNVIKENVINEYNNYMRKYFFASLPSIMHVEFKNYKFEHRNNYIIMNYDYTKGY